MLLPTRTFLTFVSAKMPLTLLFLRMLCSCGFMYFDCTVGRVNGFANLNLKAFTSNSAQNIRLFLLKIPLSLTIFNLILFFAVPNMK